MNSSQQISTMAARAWQVARAEGARGVIRRLPRQFGWAFGWLVRFDLRQLAALPPRGDGLRVERITTPDDPAVLEVLPYFIAYYSEAHLRQRLSTQETCFFARLDGRVVGAMWAQMGGPVREFRRELFVLGAEEVYYKDIIVDPPARGRAIAPALMEATRRALLAEGKSTALAFIRWQNHASIHASRKMGGRRSGVLGCLRLFGRRLPFCLRHAPRLPL